MSAASKKCVVGAHTTMFSMPCRVSRLGLLGVVAGAGAGAGADVGASVLTDAIVVVYWRGERCSQSGGQNSRGASATCVAK